MNTTKEWRATHRATVAGKAFELFRDYSDSGLYTREEFYAGSLPSFTVGPGPDGTPAYYLYDTLFGGLMETFDPRPIAIVVITCACGNSLPTLSWGGWETVACGPCGREIKRADLE